MAFTVSKTKSGVTNFQKLHLLVDGDPGITTSFLGFSNEGSDFDFEFDGTGPLSSSEVAALDSILSSFSNTETSDQVQAPAGYTEFSAYIGKATTSAVWQSKTISAAPPNTLIHIMVETESGRDAGVRSKGSTKDRKFYINNTATMFPVVTDASSRIEVYASDKDKVFFTLIGVS